MNQGFDSPRGYHIRRTRSADVPGSRFSITGGPPDRQNGRQPPPLDGLQTPPPPVENEEMSFSTFSDLQTGQTTF